MFKRRKNLADIFCIPYILSSTISVSSSQPVNWGEIWEWVAALSPMLSPPPESSRVAALFWCWGVDYLAMTHPPPGPKILAHQTQLRRTALELGMKIYANRFLSPPMFQISYKTVFLFSSSKSPLSQNGHFWEMNHLGKWVICLISSAE